MAYFKVNGYWKDDKSEFEGYIIREFDDAIPEGETDCGFTDDDIFFYGLSETDIIEAIRLGEDTVNDFVLTNLVDIIEQNYSCTNCGGGFSSDEMVFGKDDEEDLCKDCKK